MTAAASATETVIGAETVREKETVIATATTTEETMTEETTTEEIVIEEITIEETTIEETMIEEITIGETVIGIAGTATAEWPRLPGPDQEKIPGTMTPAGARSNRSICIIIEGDPEGPLKCCADENGRIFAINKWKKILYNTCLWYQTFKNGVSFEE